MVAINPHFFAGSNLSREAGPPFPSLNQPAYPEFLRLPNRFHFFEIFILGAGNQTEIMGRPEGHFTIGCFKPLSNDRFIRFTPSRQSIADDLQTGGHQEDRDQLFLQPRVVLNRSLKGSDALDIDVHDQIAFPAALGEDLFFQGAVTMAVHDSAFKKSSRVQLLLKILPTEEVVVPAVLLPPTGRAGGRCNDAANGWVGLGQASAKRTFSTSGGARQDHEQGGILRRQFHGVRLIGKGGDTQDQTVEQDQSADELGPARGLK